MIGGGATSRREFLQSARAAAAFTFIRGSRLSAREKTKQSALPPSVAALRSMREEAKPITVEERRTRIARAQELMAQNDIDAILLPGGTSLQYFTGVHWGNSERLFATVIPARGRGFCVCPSFEEERAREQLNRGPLESVECLTWHEDENPYDLVASGLRSLGKSTGTLGIEEKTPWAFSEGISKSAPGLRLTSATTVTAGCRMIKSAHELELMSIANRATFKVYDAVYGALHPGMTQAEASQLIDAAYDRVGFLGEASIEVGAFSANPHGSIAQQTIQENSVVMIDDGCLVEGYQSDITRTFVLGKATDKMKRAFDIVQHAQKRALEAARPGIECQAVDAAARKVISDAGYGPDYRFFTHRVGHGIGMDGHEWPYLVRGNRLPLETNMTFSDEPGIYVPGEFGMRLEDDIHITATGAEFFTPQSPSLEHPFG